MPVWVCVYVYILSSRCAWLAPSIQKEVSEKKVSSSISFLLSLWGSLSFRTQISSLLDWKPERPRNPTCLYHLQRSYSKPEECLAYYTGVGIWTLVLMIVEQIVLARFMSFWHTNWSHLERRTLHWDNALTDWAVSKPRMCFLDRQCRSARLAVCSTTPWLVVLSAIRKQAKQATEGKL